MSLDASKLATTDDLAKKQKVITTSSPLALSRAGALSIDLGTYQKTPSATLPLSITNDKLSLDASTFATTDDLGKKQKVITAAPPMTLSSAGDLTIDPSAYQTSFVVTSPLAMTETSLSFGDVQLTCRRSSAI